MTLFTVISENLKSLINSLQYSNNLRQVEHLCLHLNITETLETCTSSHFFKQNCWQHIYNWCVLESCQGSGVGKSLTSPSGVSEGHSMPHWDGCRERGPLTFLVFSNWDEILVIMPRAEIKERRDRTWVTPWRSILNLFRDQLPCAQKINCSLLHLLIGNFHQFFFLLLPYKAHTHSRYGVDHAVGDLILPHVFNHIKLCCSLLGDDLVCNLLEFRVEFLKQIFKEQRQQLGRRERETEEERQRYVSITKPPISDVKLSFPSDSDSRNRPSCHVMPVPVANQRRAVITIRFNNQVCQLTDKPDLASVPGPFPPPPDTQEVTSVITTPHILTYIKTKQAALVRINKEIKLSLCSQAN